MLQRALHLYRAVAAPSYTLGFARNFYGFYRGLPKSEGKEIILLIVCRLTSVAHFLPLSHPFSASSVAKSFMDHVFKLHGIPHVIVLDG